MRFMMSLCLLLSVSIVRAETTFTTRIHDIDVGARPDDQILILLTNGRVARMSNNKMNLAADLLRAREEKTLLQITIDEHTELLHLEEVSDATPSEDASTPDLNDEKDFLYTPSVIGSPEAAKRIFADHRYNAKESQCFNRAHIWAYEWRKNHNLYSSKIWIFFTRKFLRSYATFEWWFHVAPMVHVNENGSVKERAMDIKYSSRPLPIQDWANIFMKGKGPCATVSNYSEHANYPYEGYCYFQKSSMYYYQPSDIEFLEKFGTEKRTWVEAEVREAYREAFDIY